MRPLNTYEIIRRRRHGFRSGGGEARRSLGGWVIVVCSLLVLAVSGLFLRLGVGYSNFMEDLPAIESIPAWLDPQTGSFLAPTRFYDRSGQTQIYSMETPGIPRKYLSVDPSEVNHFSPQLIRAWVAMQQPDLWRSGGMREGDLLDPIPGTIAERLVSTLLLEKEAGGLRRTIQMRLLAAQVTREYGASKVLEWYLNSAGFGHLAYGAESAAQLYFGKSARNLDLMESALLVAISESPALNPFDAPAHIGELQKTALNRLLLAGLIDSDEYIRRSAETPVFASPAPEILREDSAFIDLVTGQLADRVGRERLERGGLKVITTLDLDLQRQLVCTLRMQINRIQSASPQAQAGSACEAGRLLPSLSVEPGETHPGLGALGVVTDPQTGEVLALAGELQAGGDVSRVTGHEPGSLLTPFLAAAAFSRGYSPSSMVWDIPISEGGSSEELTTQENEYQGPVSLRTAIANDHLTPLKRIFDEIGGQSLRQLWALFGLGGSIQDQSDGGVLSGGGLLTPLQAAQGFGVFAAEGILHGTEFIDGGSIQPKSILAVEDASGSIREGITQDKSLPVLSGQLAYLINHVLTDESARGKRMGASNPLEIGRPAGGKAGLTEAGDSLWAVGYTPQRLALAWLGQDTTVGGSRLEERDATGLSHALLQYAVSTMPVEGWDPPAGISEVNVCDPSGDLPTRDCPTIVKEVFLSGSEPTSTDALFRRLAVNRETGRLATVFTPAELRVEKVFMIVAVENRAWAEKAGFPLAPTEYDTIQAPAFNPDVNITSPAVFSYVRGKTEILGTARKDGFTQYRLEAGKGLNPDEWVQIGGGNAPVEDGILGEWDTLGKEGLYAIRLIVVDDAQQYDSAVIQVAVDNTPPVVTIPFPQDGEEVTGGTDTMITFRADASDSIGISRVEWWLDNTRIGSREQEPFIMPWQATAGEHVLVARAFDLAGNMGESKPVRFTVR